ncbi:crotonase/enoyl-CoA hydratase family protein [Cognatishimia activa]|uniref:Putative enoyl-CoA hydratase echA8 n=1 Tax=Cognatishimia activa TaxID=1715691 RepID=A0A0P1IPR6_9RHOB|nr:crotonase/enoyl-CoA hydratase family protein [Cognatishimia activa]CUJ21562.1 putative enoyl-CoA hydratase echA8 [Cognatishimia activa]CUK25458.1 putative enoyl-CoA hydratase echA8 [Cognatishimia activa]
MYDTISINTDARGVATLTLARPEKHNALSAQMIAELTDAANMLGQDDTVRVVVLTGEGKSFCAGGDLAWMQEQMAADRETRFSEARKIATMLYALNTLPKPLIGRLQGNAFGGGVGMTSVCDVAIGVDTLTMGLTETRLGLIPATIGPYVLVRMGETMARRVFMSSRLFGAEEAVSLGLLAKAVSADDLDKTVEAEVIPYLTCAPEAIARAKALTRRLGTPINDDVIDHTISELVACWEGQEAKDGVAAFFEKRPAPWIKQTSSD